MKNRITVRNGKRGFIVDFDNDSSHVPFETRSEKELSSYLTGIKSVFPEAEIVFEVEIPETMSFKVGQIEGRVYRHKCLYVQ